MLSWERRPALAALVIFVVNGALVPLYLGHLPQALAVSLVVVSAVVVVGLSELSVKRRRQVAKRESRSADQALNSHDIDRSDSDEAAREREK